MGGPWVFHCRVLAVLCDLVVATGSGETSRISDEEAVVTGDLQVLRCVCVTLRGPVSAPGCCN